MQNAVILLAGFWNLDHLNRGEKPDRFCGEYPGPRFEDKFRSANQTDGISVADGGKMADS